MALLGNISGFSLCDNLFPEMQEYTHFPQCNNTITTATSGYIPSQITSLPNVHQGTPNQVFPPSQGK